MKCRVLYIVFLTYMSLQVSCRSQPVDYIKSVTALTEVFGDGQKTVAAIVEYEDIINNSTVSPEDFAVSGRTVTNAYTNFSPEKSLLGADGPYVVLELSPDDPEAPTILNDGRETVIREAVVNVRQVSDVETVEGAILKPSGIIRVSDEQVNLVVDDFLRTEYLDPATGETLKYNLFIPHGYDTQKAYPLVLFMHDAGTTSTNTRMTLLQGLGAVVWAEPYEQVKHPCFVLAPQYPVPIVNDDSQASDYLDITMDLISELTVEYNIDTDRIYATGQSEGCMMAIAMNIKYPGFFAASFLVAGQWDASLVAPMAGEKLWIVVSEGDMKAFPGMNAVTEALERHGAKVARGYWDGRSDINSFQVSVNKMLLENANVNYTVLREGTVVPEGLPDNAVSNHIYTWHIAYDIEGIRDWLFRQVKGLPAYNSYPSRSYAATQ